MFLLKSLLKIVSKHHCLLTCMYCNVFQRPCQQLLKSFFVVFLQHLRITLFANLSLLYSYLVSVSTPICTFGKKDFINCLTCLYCTVYMSSCQDQVDNVVFLQHFEIRRLALYSILIFRYSYHD